MYTSLMHSMYQCTSTCHSCPCAFALVQVCRVSFVNACLCVHRCGCDCLVLGCTDTLEDRDTTTTQHKPHTSQRNTQPMFSEPQQHITTHHNDANNRNHPEHQHHTSQPPTDTTTQSSNVQRTNDFYLEKLCRSLVICVSHFAT